MIKHSIVIKDGEHSDVFVFCDGEVYVAVAGQHPNFLKIVESLLTRPQDASVVDLFDMSKAVSRNFTSGRVKVEHGVVYFDGEPVHNTLTTQIVRFVEEGVKDYEPLVAFMDKVMDNPSRNSREQLFLWLDNGDFTITPKGDFVGYKGVRMTGEVGYSTRAAPAKDGVQVDGVSVTGYVPNKPGSVVTMPRNVVDDNQGNHCSAGLHIGTHAYASGFAEAVMEVHVNPANVVSVTSDSSRQKIRACEYTVIKFIKERYVSAVLEDDDDEDEIYCAFCYDNFVESEGDYCSSCLYEERERELQEEQEQAELDEEDRLAEIDQLAEEQADLDTRLNHLKQARSSDGRFGGRV